MNFIEDLEKIRESIKSEPWAGTLYSEFKDSADYWMKNFNDSPDNVSGWGHHNICEKCSGGIIFDIEKPKEHICKKCGHDNRTPKHDAVWVTQYRSKAAQGAMQMSLLYLLDNKEEYLNQVKTILSFYADNYDTFEVHGEWVAKGKIMWQSLTESIFSIQLMKSVAILYDVLDEEYKSYLHKNLFRPLSLFTGNEPERLVNIRLWIHSAMGIAGIIFKDDDLLDRALNGERAIRELLEGSVTKEGFWHEGSFHYHFYALQAITEFTMFASAAGRDVGELTGIILKMYKTPIKLVYRSLRMPQPHDGWPDKGLYHYVHQYEMAYKIDKDPEFFTVIDRTYREHGDKESIKPNINTLLYFTGAEAPEGAGSLDQKTANFPDTNYAVLKSKEMEVFLKYGFASKSHAHYDRNTIEIFNFAYDPSNIAYGSPLHAPWYRTTIAHNTVTVDGKNQDNFAPGETVSFDPAKNSIETFTGDVYPGVDFYRNLTLQGPVLEDVFIVKSKDRHNYDWTFHGLGTFEYDGEFGEAEKLYNGNGYEYLKNFRKPLAGRVFRWKNNGKTLTMTVVSEDVEVYATEGVGNPPEEERTGIVLRSRSREAVFNVRYEIT
jgi:hypothetical protein